MIKINEIDIISNDNNNRELLLEILFNDEYNFIKYFSQIEDSIIHDVFDKENNHSGYELYYLKFDKKLFFLKNNFNFLKLEKNLFIITSTTLGITYFISFNTESVVNYFLKSFNDSKKKQYISILSDVSKKLHSLNNKTKIIHVDKNTRFERAKSQMGISNNDKSFDDKFEELNYLSQYDDDNRKKYFNIYVKNEKDNLCIYSVLKINKPLSEIKKSLTKDIFSQMDYVYFLFFKKIEETLNLTIERFKNQSTLDVYSRRNDLVNDLTLLLKQNQIEMNEIIGKECLEDRKILIEQILRKNNV